MRAALYPMKECAPFPTQQNPQVNNIRMDCIDCHLEELLLTLICDLSQLFLQMPGIHLLSYFHLKLVPLEHRPGHLRNGDGVLFNGKHAWLACVVSRPHQIK